VADATGGMGMAGAESLRPFSEGLLPDIVQSRILDIGVVEPGGVSGIPPARFTHHAPLALTFSNPTKSGDYIDSLSIAFPLLV
jgi:hypothetical protein